MRIVLLFLFAFSMQAQTNWSEIAEKSSVVAWENVKYKYYEQIVETVDEISDIVYDTTESDYCDGFKKGYKEGYCYEQDLPCLSPLVPPCPLPRLGRDTYRDGYNDGFSKGKQDYKNE